MLTVADPAGQHGFTVCPCHCHGPPEKSNGRQVIPAACILYITILHAVFTQCVSYMADKTDTTVQQSFA